MVISTDTVITNDEFIGRSLEFELRARHDFIPTDHPVSKFAKERFRKVGNGESKDIEVLVDTNWREVNAYALSNKKIVLTSGLLNFIGSVEELDAVLSHEKRHIAEGHFEELRKRRKDVGKFVSENRSLIEEEKRYNKIKEDLMGTAFFIDETEEKEKAKIIIKPFLTV